MSTCLAPACDQPKLDLGVWEFLCLEHALEAASPRRAPDRPDLRGRCWGEGLTCQAPASTITPHGTYCAGHAPSQPSLVAYVEGDDELRSEQLAVLAVTSILGGRVESIRANLWSPRSYGESDEPARVVPGRTYARQSPARASTVALDDPRVPRNARAMAKAAKGWSVRLRVVDDPPSLVLRAWRGSLLVVASWENASFVSAWVQHSKGVPMRLQARQASALLKAA
jgi:hypothetical protein